MDTETTLGLRENKKLWWVKYDPSTNKVLGVSGKEVLPTKSFSVIQTTNKICQQITRGKVRLRDCGIIWDLEKETWDIDKKSDTLVFREYSSRLSCIIEDNPITSDMHLRLYKDDGVLEITVDYENIKRHLNLNSISNVASAEGTLFNLYFTHKNDPDYLIMIVEIDPLMLFRRKRVRLDITELTKHVDWNNLSIFTRPILHKYTIEYFDKEIRSDFALNKNTILQSASNTNFAHITISGSAKKATVKNHIEPEQDYVIANQKDLKFLVCDDTIDNIVGAFGVSTDALFKFKTVECDLDFDWPSHPIVIYKNKFLSVKNIGVTNG